MRARARPCLVLGVAAALVGLATSDAGSSAQVAKPIEGGTFRIAMDVVTSGVDSIDPALTGSTQKALILRPTCAQLMAFPGPKPEVAAGYPKVSRDGLTYTFTIKSGFRFNTGEPVTAANFARAIKRVLSPETRAEGAGTLAERFVGGRNFHDGKTTTLPGLIATQRRLVLKLTQPWPQLLDDVAIPGEFCPVPVALPLDPEGVPAPLPGSGPYYIARFIPGREIVLARNRLYRGGRPHHVSQFVVDLTSTISTTTQKVEEGAADYAFVAPSRFEDLGRKYGVNKSQFFAFPAPDTGVRTVILNSGRPLFRDNPQLRRAVNFAIDRRALVDAVGGHVDSPTDQFLYPSVPGFRDARIYPFGGNLRKARALARGHTRSGKAVLYTSNLFPFIIAQTKLIQEALRKIGIDAEIKEFPHSVFLDKISTPGEPFDLANSVGFVNGYGDPTVLNCMFDRRQIPPAEGCNWFNFDSPRYNRLLRRAEGLVGPARFKLYGRLDVELARDAAPAVPYLLPKSAVLVSKRAACHRFDRPLFDLASVCLRR